MYFNVGVKQLLYRTGQALRVQDVEANRFQDNRHMKFIPTHRPPLLHTKYKYSWYSFVLEAESTSASLCGRKD